MSAISFVGRKQELSEISAFLKKKTASIIVLKGRRRVGKSRLVEEFAKNKRFYKFTGLAPIDGITAQDQRNEFSRQLAEQTDLPEIKLEDWGKLFALLARETKTGKMIILLDEISWMASNDKTFLSKLKNTWDNVLKKNNALILILCGSVSTWIEKNIISNTAFFGRISWTLTLNPLPLNDCNKMLASQGFNASAYEKFQLLSITGGIPWYLEQMQGQYSAQENIKRQCFTKGGVLVDDFDKIFHELFEKRDGIYKKIVTALSNSPIDYDTIAALTNYPKSGRLTNYLGDLIRAGFVTKDNTWSLITGNNMALCHYRLSDNYTRFYLKYIAPKRTQIEAKRINTISFSTFPGWETIMGLQFENLVINNRHEIYRLLNIDPSTIIYDNPFFQRKTTRQKGCQIDFLIQTKFKTLYLCEVKFSRNRIKKQVIDEIKEKIKRLSLPRGMAVLPVLIHVNGISNQIIEQDYFHSIIDFSEFLQ